MAVKAIRLDSTGARIGIAIAAALLLVLAFFSMKWGLANTAVGRAAYKEVAALLVEWAPDDPRAHFVSAVLHEKTFMPEDQPISLAEFEKAVMLAPHNYIYWLELGKARERSGDQAGAEKILRRALELSPNNAQVRWSLGNSLLRQGRSDEAFAEIRAAVAADGKFTNPAAAMAWQIFDGDMEMVRRTIGDSAALNAALAGILVNQKRLDEAFAIWTALPAEDKRVAHREMSNSFFIQLIDAKKYRLAAEVYTAALAEDGEKAVPGSLIDGGFEGNLKPQNPAFFEWHVAEGSKPQVGVDNVQKHSGERSLVLVFNSPDGKDFRSVAQTVAVEPGRSYQFELFYKTDLKADKTLKWDVSATADHKVIASTDAVAAVSDWASQRVTFTVPAGVEAVTIRLARAGCGPAGSCPISGRIWFDDLKLSAG